eukprot:3746492-Rhodomonas_salina.1
MDGNLLRRVEVLRCRPEYPHHNLGELCAQCCGTGRCILGPHAIGNTDASAWSRWFLYEVLEDT